MAFCQITAENRNNKEHLASTLWAGGTKIGKWCYKEEGPRIQIIFTFCLSVSLCSQNQFLFIKIQVSTFLNRKMSFMWTKNGLAVIGMQARHGWLQAEICTRHLFHFKSPGV